MTWLPEEITSSPCTEERPAFLAHERAVAPLSSPSSQRCRNSVEASGAAVADTLLLAESDTIARVRMASELSARGYRVSSASTLEEALPLIVAENPLRAVVDYQLPDGTGLDLLSRIVARTRGARVVILSRCASLRGAVSAIRIGAADFLAKPATVSEIDAILRDLAVECRLAAAPAPSLRDVDQWHAEEILRSMNSNVPATARVLGVEARTLRRILAWRASGAGAES